MTRALIAAAALSLLAAPAASAATRYASPTGGMADTTCPQTTPCDIQTAVEGPGFVPGDSVVVLPGTYAIGADTLNTSGLVEGAPGQAIPVIRSDGAGAVSSGSATTLRRLRIEAANAGSSRGIDLVGATALGEQLQVIGTGTTGSVIQLRDAAGLRDSVVWQQVAGGVAVVVGGTGTASLRNVTAVASGAGGIAVTLPEPFGFGSPGAVSFGATLDNVIARGSGAGVSAVDDGTAGDDTIDAILNNTNYSSLDDPVSTDADIQLGSGNQATAPAFANAAAGDLRQVPGSPTLNAGSATGIGSLDFEGQPRLQGAAVDIGADEATDPSSLLELVKSGKLKRTRTLKVGAKCALVNCTVAAAANLVVKGTSSATTAKIFKLQNATATLTAGQEGSIAFKLSKKAFKRLRAAGKAKLNVAATASDPLGFSGTEQIGLKFKKAKKSGK